MTSESWRPPKAVGVIRRAVRTPIAFKLEPPPAPPTPPHAGRHAAVFVVALIAIIGIGMMLLMLPVSSQTGLATPWIDALFTAVSAVSVTGLVTVDTATHWSRTGQAVILVLIQIGGLGFMVGASIVLMILRRGATRLGDVLLLKEGAPVVSLREAVVLSRQVAVFTVVTEAIGAAILALRFSQDMALADAAWFGVFHAVSAFSNAGFDLQGEFVSMIPYRDSLVVNGAIMMLIQAGALSYVVLADVATTRRWARLAVDSKIVLVVNGVLLVGGSLAFLLIEWTGVLAPMETGTRVLVAVFQSVAARTAGFATVNYGELEAETLFLWMALMLIGGASGSTAGGVKLATVGVIAVALVSTLAGQSEPRAFNRRIPAPLVFRAMTVVAIMLIIHFTATTVLVATQRGFGEGEMRFVALMFEAMSALATVGLSTGITPQLETGGKLILCALMFIGRLGPLTVVYALQLRQRQRRVPMHYAPTSVRIG